MAMNHRLLRPGLPYGLRTLFFRGVAGSGSVNAFENPDRWFFDRLGLRPANTIPSATDHVVLQVGSLSYNTITVTVAQLTVETSLSANFNVRGNVTIGTGLQQVIVSSASTVTSSGLITLTNAGSLGTFTAPAVRLFNSNNVGTINGAAYLFTSNNFGNIFGDAVFSGESYNGAESIGNVYGNAAFYNFSANSASGSVFGTATLYDASNNYGYADSVIDLRSPPPDPE